jgi:hypothetical protein
LSKQKKEEKIPRIWEKFSDAIAKKKKLAVIAAIYFCLPTKREQISGAGKSRCNAIGAMGNISKLEMAKLLKRLILFAAEIDEIATTTFESIGDGTNNNNAESSSPESSDDFVLVPSNLPNVDAQAYDRK